MAFIIAAILVVVFTVNVALGAVAGDPILGNVAEMLVLFSASIAFVVGILKAEATRKQGDDKNT